MNRKSLALALAIGLGSAVLTPDAGAQNLEAVPVASGLTQPTGVFSVPSDPDDRLFVTEQAGRIRVVKNGSVLATDFINLSSLILSGGERGLLGMAFHPDYQSNGYFFVSYTNNGGNSMLRRYTVSAGNPDVANAASGVTIYGPISQPFSNHNGGCIRFGADGMLYLGLGDGGSGSDPQNNGQDLNTPLGKMLRFDVDIASPHIPSDNPFVGVAGLDEIWAYGLRNPWRFSFDRDTGDLWIGDVGQNAWEEIDFQPASSTGGENYGWRIMEGTHCYDPNPCTPTGVMPVHEYGHGGANCSVTGGYVARGPGLPNHQGRYFFADYCRGHVMSFDPSSPSVTTDHDSDLGTNGFIRSFGEDSDGDLLVIQGSTVYRIQEECNPVFNTYCTANPNSTGSGAMISASGSGSVADNNLTLAVAGLPANQPGLFFYGPNQDSTPFSQGILCIETPVIRLTPAVFASFLGTANRTLDFTQFPLNMGGGQITGGSTWNFQFWYRDPSNGSNLSNAIEITFCP